MSPRSALPSLLPPTGAQRDSELALAGQPGLPLRLYGDRTPEGAVPLVLHLHGGAFVAGDLDSGATVAGLLAAAGAVVVSLAYPLAPAHPFPQGIEAAYAALGWTFQQRRRLAGSGSRVYLAGEEAGANLAAALSMVARDRAHPPLAGQVLISPLLDPCVGTPSVRAALGAQTCCKWAEGWQQYLRSPMDAEHPYAVPGASRRLVDLPPTLVLAGADDPMRDEAQAYAQKLEQAGVAVRLRVLGPETGWPGTLLEKPAAGACPCGDAVVGQLRQFFADTRPAKPRPPPPS